MSALACNRILCAALALVAGAVFSPMARAQSVSLSGMLGNKALLVVDGGEPKSVAPGESFKGVRVISTQGNNAVLEVAGQRQTLRVGDSPVSVGTPINTATSRRIVLSADAQGHFFSQGLVNSRPVQFLVDTGATTIGMSSSDADRIGLPYKQGTSVQVSTANGVVPGWRVRLSSVRLSDVEVHDIEAIITPIAMPFVLLGNSYLTRFQMTRNNDQLVLEKRY
jgi:aspartyl protease family protein